MKCKEIAICKLKWNYTEMGQTGQRRLSATEWLLLLCYRNLNKWDSSRSGFLSRISATWRLSGQLYVIPVLEIM